MASNFESESKNDEYEYYCSSCNKEVGKFDRFCKHCGAELENDIADFDHDTNNSDEQIDENNEPEYVLIKDKDWSVIDGLPCKVGSFQPIGAFVQPDGEVISANPSIPYASITFECTKLGEKVKGYICHKIDFYNLWTVFKETELSKDSEVIVFWTKNNYTKGVGLFSAIMPKLIVWVCKQGAYNLMTTPDGELTLSGSEYFEAMKPIIELKPEVMK